MGVGEGVGDHSFLIIVNYQELLYEYTLFLSTLNLFYRLKLETIT